MAQDIYEQLGELINKSPLLALLLLIVVLGIGYFLFKWLRVQLGI